MWLELLVFLKEINNVGIGMVTGPFPAGGDPIRKMIRQKTQETNSLHLYPNVYFPECQTVPESVKGVFLCAADLASAGAKHEQVVSVLHRTGVEHHCSQSWSALFSTMFSLISSK